MLIRTPILYALLLMLAGCTQPPEGYFPPAMTNGQQATPSYILAVRDIKPEGVTAALNPSIVSDGVGGFVVSFRVDDFAADFLSVFQSKVGILRLDAGFNVVPGVFFLDSASTSRQDGRLFRHQGQTHLLYNDIPPFERFRTLALASLKRDDDSWKLFNDSSLEAHPTRVEKNWSPFSFVDGAGQQHLLMSYSVQPHRVLKVVGHDVVEFSKCDRQLPWKWGSVRGGTPAIRIGDEFLSFFHSVHVDEVYGYRWYVFGAYTFESKPPFCMKRISPSPVVFKELYSSLHLQPKSVVGRIAFPAGLEVGSFEGREALIVTYGDSDAASKILILDREKFLNSLLAVE